MTAKVEIMNMALTSLGAARIGSPDLSGEKTTALKQSFDRYRDALLRAHPFNFAMTRATLGAIGTAPAFGWAFQYEFPSDPFALRIWQVGDPTAGLPVPFVSEGRRILTDAGAPLPVLYIARVTDTSLFDALFVDLLAARLAAEHAYKITNSRSKEKDAWDRYKEKLPEGRSIDGQEGRARDQNVGEYEAARH